MMPLFKKSETNTTFHKKQYIQKEIATRRVSDLHEAIQIRTVLA